MNMLQQRQQETLNEIKENLSKYGKCAVVRPTGFGKTHIAMKLAKEYKKVLYIYPLGVIREQNKDKVKNVTWCTASRLAKLNFEDEKVTKTLKSFDLVILDELHTLGSDLRLGALKELVNICDKAKIIGMSATPDRHDGVNLIHEILDGVETTWYDLGNAIVDGILPKPLYRRCGYDIEKEVDRKKTLLGDKIRAFDNVHADFVKQAKETIRALDIEVSQLINAKDIIKSSVGERDYIKFIVFFSSMATLDLKKNDVIEWFKGAYPDYIIRPLAITSRSEERENIKFLSEFTKQDKTIDLIFSIDMLNMGYHIQDLTGVIMLRGTGSAIVYSQQLGRCLSVKGEYAPIILDFVNNADSKPYKMKKKDKNTIVLDEKVDTKNRLLSANIMNLIVDDQLIRTEELILKVNKLIEKLDESKIIEGYVKYFQPVDFISKEYGIREAVIIHILKENGVYEG